MKKSDITQFILSYGLHLIIGLGLIIRLTFYISLEPWNENLIDKTLNMSDEIEYHNVALDLEQKRSFENFSSFRTPLYTLFVALTYGLTNNSIATVLFIQILMNLLSVYLVYRIANEIFTHKIALLSALLFAVDPLQIIYSIQLLTDVMFVFLFLFSIYFLCKYFKTNTIKTLSLSALFLGLATLTRPITFLFPFLSIILLLLFHKTSLTYKLKHAALFGFVFIISISPWLSHNYCKYGVAKLSSISGYNLLIFNVASTEAYKTQKPIAEVQKYFNYLAIQRGSDSTALNPSNKEPFKNSDIYTGIAKEYIKDNFLLYIKRNIIGIAYMYVAVPTGLITTNFNIQSKYHSEHYAGAKFSGGFKYLGFFNKMSLVELIITVSMFLFLFLIYVFSFLKVLNPGRKRDSWFYILLFVLIILYFSALTGVVGASRYRLPIMPFLYILSAAGFSFFTIKNKLFSERE
ncbi:MAG: glycosyltransferase family 39 protein [Prolixibacteraceae bacterium]|jgi:4-amino-4-deoxy-L-arabinose transferase-like glycosyltransferase|nr:glycosyltransferase family 39 protein [Prolixibacteraceae bacterium]